MWINFVGAEPKERLLVNSNNITTMHCPDGYSLVMVFSAAAAEGLYVDFGAETEGGGYTAYDEILAGLIDTKRVSMSITCRSIQHVETMHNENTR